jgi:molybdopterin molybdotransferase
VLKAQDIGVLASLGLDSIRVACKPRVGVITTGSELCNPGETLKPGMIYNSNGYQLSAQAAAMDVTPKYYGTAVDKMENLESVISEALGECEVVLLSGGVSMGEFDLVPDSLRHCGVEIRFHRLAIKPGKPTLFGQAGAVDKKETPTRGSERGTREKVERFVFGMPGNPVSTFVIFEVFVKPFLYHMMGIEYEPSVVRGKLVKDFRRRDTERVEYIPVRLVDDEIHSIHYHGSSHLNALSRANALIRIERGVGSLDKGSWLDVRQI